MSKGNSNIIARQVREVNSLIALAVDTDGEPLDVYDSSSSWQVPMRFKPYRYVDGTLYEEFTEWDGTKYTVRKGRVKKANMEFDNPLPMVAKWYRKAIKQNGKPVKPSLEGNEEESTLDGVRHNTSQNGIEVKFAVVPNYEDTSYLKRKGFRWSGRQKLWYARYSEALFNEIKAKFDKELSPEEIEAAKQKAEQARVNEAAEKNNRIRNGFENWAEANSLIYSLGSDTFQNFDKHKPQDIIIRGIDYHFNRVKDHYEHLPKGRKRPDNYSSYHIHHKLQDEVMANGGYISFQTLWTNVNRRSSIPRYTLDDLNRLLRYDWMQSKENFEYRNEVQAKVDEASEVAKQWFEYRKRVFSSYVSGSLYEGKTNDKKPVYIKDKNGMWIPVYISRIESEITGSTRQDQVNIEDRRGYIIFSSWKLIQDVYPENPATTPEAKSFLQLFPFSDKEAKPAATKSAESEPLYKEDTTVYLRESADKIYQEKYGNLPLMISHIIESKDGTGKTTYLYAFKGGGQLGEDLLTDKAPKNTKGKLRTHDDIIKYLESEGVFIRTGTTHQVTEAVKKLDKSQLPDIYFAFNPKGEQAKIDKFVQSIYMFEYRRVKPEEMHTVSQEFYDTGRFLNDASAEFMILQDALAIMSSYKKPEAPKSAEEVKVPVDADKEVWQIKNEKGNYFSREISTGQDKWLPSSEWGYQYNYAEAQRLAEYYSKKLSNGATVVKYEKPIPDSNAFEFELKLLELELELL